VSPFTFEGIATIRCHRAGREISGQSFRLIPGALVVTDLRKARPTDLRRRYQRERHGGLARTGPSGSRSAAGHRNGRCASSRERPRLPSRNSSRVPSMSDHDKNNSGFTTTNRSGSLNIIQHVRPLGRSGGTTITAAPRSRDKAERFPGLTFQGSGSADVDCLLNFVSITNYTDDLLGDSAG
jgi:hypothetical protein